MVVLGYLPKKIVWFFRQTYLFWSLPSSTFTISRQNHDTSPQARSPHIDGSSSWVPFSFPSPTILNVFKDHLIPSPTINIYHLCWMFTRVSGDFHQSPGAFPSASDPKTSISGLIGRGLPAQSRTCATRLPWPSGDWWSWVDGEFMGRETTQLRLLVGITYTLWGYKLHHRIVSGISWGYEFYTS